MKKEKKRNKLKTLFCAILTLITIVFTISEERKNAALERRREEIRSGRVPLSKFKDYTDTGLFTYEEI